MASPLDRMLRVHVAPVLRDLGFERKGRLWVRFNEAGDVASIEVRAWRLGAESFFVEYGIVPASAQAAGLRVHGSVKDTLWPAAGVCWRRLPMPEGIVLSQFSSDETLWGFYPQDEESEARCGIGLAKAMTEDVAPTLLRLLDREALVAFIRGLDDQGRLEWSVHDKRAAELKVVLDQLPLVEAQERFAEYLDGLDYKGAPWTKWARKHLAARAEAEAGRSPTPANGA